MICNIITDSVITTLLTIQFIKKFDNEWLSFLSGIFHKILTNCVNYLRPERWKTDSLNFDPGVQNKNL